LAVRPILELPHPKLREKARKVRNIDSTVLSLAYDMVDTMRDASGVGLAANQVGELKRVIVIQLPEEDEARIYINPEIVYREGEREIEEGCLSIPGYRGTIKRSVMVRFRALNHEAKTVKLKAEDLLAQALEHEVDHLEGILYVDHLESHQKLVKIELDYDEPESVDGENSAGAGSDLVLPSDEDVAAFGNGTDSGLDPGETPASLKIK
jgi:peptide deformylase